MAEVLYYAIPYFLLLLAVEYLAYRHLSEDHDDLVARAASSGRATFGIHTERIGKLPRPIEAVFNTPSHHRVHHGTNEQYLDRNYGGILIIWDRMFGTYEPEGERVRYGLTTQLKTFRPVKVAFHEYIAMWHDLKRAKGVRAKFGVAFHGPGWTPPGVKETEATRG